MEDKNQSIIALVVIGACMVALTILSSNSTVAQNDPDVYPPNMGQVMTAAMNGINDDIEIKNSTVASLGIDAIEMFDDDLAAADQVKLLQQNIMIHNTHASQFVCWMSTTWGSTCALEFDQLVDAGAPRSHVSVCNGGTKTTAEGMVQPGQSREIRLDGTRRPCIVGSAASTTYQTERWTSRGRE